MAIGDRVGHESEKITYRYAHLFPTKQAEMADRLNFERMGIENVVGIEGGKYSGQGGGDREGRNYFLPISK